MKQLPITPLICFLAVVFLTLPACTSVQDMVESGDYEQTIELAQRRLTGKQKKNPKLVAALERAFNRVTAEDMAQARRMAESGNADWSRVFGIYEDIQRRQDALRPLLPLVDKRGRRAQFRFAKVDELMVEASENAAAQIYEEALRLLAEGRNGNKAAARDAVMQFERIDRYRRNYRDAYELALEAEELGRVFVMVSMVNQTGGYLPRGFEDELLRVRTSGMNDRWRVYDFTPRPERDYDYNARIVIHDIQVSPERISERNYIDEKEITDGEEYVLDANGNVAKDTLGNDITRPRQVIVRAEVTEVLQTKTAIVTGSLVLYDNRLRRIVDEDQLTAEAIFENYASTFRGDRRALSNDSRRRIGNRPIPFPSNEALILDAAAVLKPKLQERLANSYRVI
jgi:hypothetical protein